MEYDKYMGGVDHSDQMVSYSTFHGRTLKWWKHVIFHMISLTTLNAHMIYKELAGNRALLARQFRKKLVKAMILSVDPANVPAFKGKEGGRPVQKTNDTIVRMQGQHFPRRIAGPGKKTPSRACVVCVPAERKKFQHENPGHKRKSHHTSATLVRRLCVDPCFRLYHKYANYEQKYFEVTLQLLLQKTVTELKL